MGLARVNETDELRRVLRQAAILAGMRGLDDSHADRIERFRVYQDEAAGFSAVDITVDGDQTIEAYNSPTDLIGAKAVDKRKLAGIEVHHMERGLDPRVDGCGRELQQIAAAGDH